MQKTLVMFLAAFAIVLFGSIASSATDLSVLPEELQEKVDDLLATRFPPEQYGITLNPEVPVGGEPTSIEVEIYNPSDVTGDETSEVYVYYSVNFGESWDVIELGTDDDKVWYGELPAFESGDEVIYSVRAVDSSTNVFVTIACKADKEYDLAPDMRIDGDCVRDDISTCEDGTPRGCLFRIAGDDSPADDEEDVIAGYGDYVDFRVGYDDNNVYLDLATEASVDGGTMTPTDVHIYAAAIVNKDKIGNDTNLDALLEAGGVLVFSPLLKQFESTGMVSDCFFGYKKGDTFAIDSKNVKCVNKENHLLFVVPWKTIQSLGDNESGVYQFFSLTGVVTDISDFNNIQGGLLDSSHVTNAHFTEDTYFVVE